MGGDAIFPSLRSHAGDIFVALDTSGSIEDADLAQFVGELNAIKGTLPVRMTCVRTCRFSGRLDIQTRRA